MNTKLSQLLAFASILASTLVPGLATAAPRVTPFAAAGGGVENTSTGGTNFLIYFQGGIATGGNPCKTVTDSACMFRRGQLMLVHVDGEVAGEAAEGTSLPFSYTHIRFTPIAIPFSVQDTNEVKEWIGRYGIDKSYQVTLLPSEITKDETFGRDLSLRANLIGVDVAVQTFPTQVLGGYLAASANVLGARIVNATPTAQAGTVDGRLFSVGAGQLKAGLILAFTQSFVVRATAGAEYAMSFKWESGRQLHELDVFGEIGADFSRLVQAGLRLSKSFERFDGEDRAADTRLTANLAIRVDWLEFGGPEY